ncbi:hypothetical protein SCLCIDRAFT_1216740 [Scleroderma citrinum Foug A]|uniref:Uncharacterized protein n=1 Tax=Scleroderma citrinum Foug A TaxID=1036808 RepID=A0A0C3DX25_9AGAM|nr:hypothetical protein SCLCIDRAFT_1216740 [Scleroderma citrinum Foug A]
MHAHSSARQRRLIIRGPLATRTGRTHTYCSAMHTALCEGSTGSSGTTNLVISGTFPSHCTRTGTPLHCTCRVSERVLFGVEHTTSCQVISVPQSVES